jgi:hypothetical protein
MSRRDKYVDCPVCHEESRLAEQRYFTESHVAFVGDATLDDLFAVIRRDGRSGQPDTSSR